MTTVGKLISSILRDNNLKANDILCADIRLQVETVSYEDLGCDEYAYYESLADKILQLPIGYDHQELKELLLTNYTEEDFMSLGSIIWFKDGSWLVYESYEICDMEDSSFIYHKMPTIPDFLLKK